MSHSTECKEGGLASARGLLKKNVGTASKGTASEYPYKAESIQRDEADSPTASCVSMKSNWSMRTPNNFRERDIPARPKSIQQDEADSPTASCVSMKSDWSMRTPNNFRERDIPARPKSIQQDEADSPTASCVSMKSDWSMRTPNNFRERDIPACQERVQEEKLQKVTPKAQRSQSAQKDLTTIFKALQENVMLFVKTELKMFERLLTEDISECFGSLKEEDSSARDGALKITLHFLRKMKHNDLANSLEKSQSGMICQPELKANLKNKYQTLFEGIAKQGNPTLLKKIYTELYITEGGSGEVNTEHEVRQIETASRRIETQEIPIDCNDIFKPLKGQDKPIKAVLTKGVAGIGKTVSVQKFILDWAEGNNNQDIKFIFPLPFRELNLQGKKEQSLLDVINQFFPKTKDLIKTSHCKTMFIFDGLDECRLPLDFKSNKTVCDLTEPASLDVLLTNLIKGNLLPSALLWITSRPAATNRIPPECVDQVTEVRGFSDPQKEKYFRRRLSDQDLASRVITHMKSSRSLYIMCHIPVFCWISATVLECMLGETKNEEIPKTLTQMYTYFLVFQTKQRNQKFDGTFEVSPQWNKASLLSLGKLAFKQLAKGNLIFYEEDLKESGIDIKEASLYSGVCTQIFREECGIHNSTVYCFVHLSIQEFLAALYVFLEFINNNNNSFTRTEQSQKPWLKIPFKETSLYSLHKPAIDQALQSNNGHLDLFLRFLLGLSMKCNQILLKGLLNESSSHLQNKEKTVTYIKKLISQNTSPERSINLFHCLNELSDHSLVKEIQSYLSSGQLTNMKLSPAQWSALVFLLLTSEDELDEFDLRKYGQSEECLLKLLPVAKEYRKVLLCDCSVTGRGCANLASALHSNPSSLRELDLSGNEVEDSGVKHLSVLLENPRCKLESWRLCDCNITKHGCAALASALCSDHSNLKVLDLSENNLGDSGLENLTVPQGVPLCSLKSLRLIYCNLTSVSCELLATILSSSSSQLRELDLTNNDHQDSGVKHLSSGLRSSNCKVRVLRLSGCLVSEEGCRSLASALTSNPSHLRKLDLSYNHPGEAGVKQLVAMQGSERCKLKMLNVEYGSKIRIKPGLRKYSFDLRLDQDTAHTQLCLSEGNKTVTLVGEEQPYPFHPERFDVYRQALCKDSLSGRCYWEAECHGEVSIAVAYKGIKRKKGKDCRLGDNAMSWSLHCHANSYTATHNKIATVIPAPSSSHRIGVYLDSAAGILSFFSVSSDTYTLTPLKTFHTKFTEPLYPGVGVWKYGGLVSLCNMK